MSGNDWWNKYVFSLWQKSVKSVKLRHVGRYSGVTLQPAFAVRDLYERQYWMLKLAAASFALMWHCSRHVSPRRHVPPWIVGSARPFVVADLPRWPLAVRVTPRNAQGETTHVEYVLSCCWSARMCLCDGFTACFRWRFTARIIMRGTGKCLVTQWELTTVQSD